MKRLKRRRLNLKRISILIIIIVLVVCLIKFLPNKNNELKNETIITPEPLFKENKLSLVMVGDALIHDRLYNDAYHDGSYDFKPYLKLIKEKIKDYDD